ncbi:hypothetical protein KM908_20360 [Alkalihalobacillus clausii]|uniref:hypothetical protein n=1 Tax=Shouchella clausii TaxID=79880 RepID=UPI001C216591|nr:hypothetical protein [Shouchella clausii]MBU8598468.1 hypothetical protein [Shouchella clausii]
MLNPEKMMEEKLTIPEIKLLYGDLGIQVLECLGISDELMYIPQLYRAYAEYLLVFSSRQGGKNLYEKNLKIFNDDVLMRFPNKIEFTSILDRQFLYGDFFGKLKNNFPTGNGILLKNEYEKPFRKKHFFSLEEHMRKALFDYLLTEHDVVFAEKEKKLTRGRADITLGFGKRNVVVELKTSAAKNKDLYQVFDYVQADADYDEAVLIAESFDAYQMELAKRLDISLVRYEIGRNDDEPEFILCLERANVIEENCYFNNFYEEVIDNNDIWFEHPLFEDIKAVDLKYFERVIDAIKIYDELIKKGNEVYGR